MEAALAGYLRQALNHAEIEEKQIQLDSALTTLQNENRENCENMDRAVAEKNSAKSKLESIMLIAGLDDPKFIDYQRMVSDYAELESEVSSLSVQADAARQYLNHLALAWERWLRSAEVLGWSISIDQSKLSALRSPDPSLGLAAVPGLVEEFNRIWNESKENLLLLNSSINLRQEKKSRLETELNQLKSDRTASTPLLDRLRSSGIHAHTLARVVEITPAGEEWWEIIEALLGDDRHATVVDDPADFIAAKRHWLELTNSEPLVDPTEIVAIEATSRTLAAFCDTSHPLARRYIDWRLGRLLAVADRSELDSHTHAAARDGAVCEDHVLRQLIPVKELTLGEKGLRRLRDAKQKEFDDLKAELSEMIRKRDDIQHWLTNGKTAGLSRTNLPEGAAGLQRLPALRIRAYEKSEALKLLATPDRATRLNQMRTLVNEIAAADQTIGSLRGPLSGFKISESRLKESVATALQEIQTAVITLHSTRAKLPVGILDQEISRRLLEIKREGSTWKSRHAFAENAESKWRDSASSARDRRLEARKALLTAFGDEFSEFDPKEESNDRFDHRLEEIRLHEVERFRGLAETRRSDWEKRLQEDVLDRLRERLKEAHDTIKDFRRILNHPIGGYRYALRQVRDKTHDALWKLLDQTEDGQLPSDTLFDHKLKEQIEEAKRELMAAVDNPTDKHAAALLDYRNYHHYDLEMVPQTHDDDSEGRISLQSRGRSLSGGEGQAPFFVAMLAAFHRVYDLGKGEAQSNLGLVVMDEAFSKLSAGHIADCLSLAENFGLQLILAFPMDRLGTMIHHADSIVQCRVQRTLDSKGAPTEIINDVIRWTRDAAAERFLS